MLAQRTISSSRTAFYYQNRTPMGEIDTQFLKLYAEEELFLSEVIKDDAELLLLDSWLMDRLDKSF